MNPTDPHYSKYALCREMFETIDILRSFKPDVQSIARRIENKKGILITGEGSSRLVPGKQLIYQSRKDGFSRWIGTEGATQARDYRLEDLAIIGLSNSGKTSELIQLFDQLKTKNHRALIGITAHDNTLLADRAQETLVLNCGKEAAVAATKSVVEQALTLQAVYAYLMGRSLPDMHQLANLFSEVLLQDIHDPIIDRLAKADTLYFAGRNDGIAEELTLKTNEITRKKSDYLEGTYGVHGIEEVMESGDALIWIDPFPEQEDKFYDVLVKGVGLDVVAIAHRPTRFDTILIPSHNSFDGYLQLAAGWNLLVEIGLALKVDLDKPTRARKIGNEFNPQS